MWEPIPFEALYDMILAFEKEEQGELYNLWEIIKITPQKWQEPGYGDEGGGFWVVAIAGERVIWYNDIEEGFNISRYKTYGTIAEYWCNQSDLKSALIQIQYMLRHGGGITGQAGPPLSF